MSSCDKCGREIKNYGVLMGGVRCPNWCGLEPLQRFWMHHSGWYSPESPSPEDGLSEGKLCIDTWNAAIDEAIRQIDSDDYCSKSDALIKLRGLKYEKS